MKEKGAAHTPKQLTALVVMVVVLAATIGWQRMMGRHFEYRCAGCGDRFGLSPLQALLAPHRIGRKLVKCPACGRVSWAVRVPKDR